MQTEYSLWTRNPELGVLETCKSLGIAFVAFSPLARGALADPALDPGKLEDKDLRKNHPRFTETHWARNKSLIDKFEALATEANITPAQLSLAWVLSRGDHVHAIPGTRSIAHLKENFLASQVVVSSQTISSADALINQSTVSGHRYPEGMRRTIDTEEFE